MPQKPVSGGLHTHQGISQASHHLGLAGTACELAGASGHHAPHESWLARLSGTGEARGRDYPHTTRFQGGALVDLLHVAETVSLFESVPYILPLVACICILWAIVIHSISRREAEVLLLIRDGSAKVILGAPLGPRQTASEGPLPFGKTQFDQPEDTTPELKP
jgi:hypothetical protein